MQTWFKLENIFILILILICIYLTYMWIDSRASLDHARQEEKNLQQTALFLKDLLQDTTKQMTKTHIREILWKYEKGDFVLKENANNIEAENIIFIFEGEILKKIDFLNDYLSKGT